MVQPSTQKDHQRDINGDSGYSGTQYSPDQQLHVRWKWETPGNVMNCPKTNTNPSTMRSVIPALLSVLLAQNLGTLSSWLRLMSPSWTPMINWSIVPKPSKTDFHVSFHASEINWGCISLGSDSPNSWKTWTGWLTLRGLFHQKIYITKFMATYASITISRWVTGRCSMPCAMHCIMNHDVWRKMRDLASQSILLLSLISASVGIMNDSG